MMCRILPGRLPGQFLGQELYLLLAPPPVEINQRCAGREGGSITKFPSMCLRKITAGRTNWAMFAVRLSIEFWGMSS